MITKYKKIEKDTGIIRSDEIEGVDGFEAVRLWQRYQWGDEKALETLISYNNADIMNLEPLMEMAYEKMKSKSFHRIFPLTTFMHSEYHFMKMASGGL